MLRRHSVENDEWRREPGGLQVKNTRLKRGLFYGLLGAALPSRKALLTADATKAAGKAAKRKFARPGAERTNATLTKPTNSLRPQQRPRLLPLRQQQRQRLRRLRPKHRQKRQPVEHWLIFSIHRFWLSFFSFKYAYS